MLVDELKAIVGADGWTTDADELEPHVTEWRNRARGKALIMVSPASTAEVAAVVKACAGAGVGIVPQGGNTGLCGGAIPDNSGRQVLLSMSGLDEIRTIDAGVFWRVAEAGCVCAEVEEAAGRAGAHLAAGLVGQFPGSGNEVVVDVGLEGVDDPRPVVGGDLDVLFDIPGGVDDKAPS